MGDNDLIYTRADYKIYLMGNLMSGITAFRTIIGRVVAMVVGSLITAACATSGVKVSRIDPPNHPAAASLKRIAVVQFEGPHGSQSALEFESMLAQASVNGQAYFHVIDRRTLDNAIKELKLQTTGLVDAKTAARIGKFIGVDGIYTGTEFTPSVQTQSYTEKRFDCPPSGNTKKLFNVCKNPTERSVSCTRRVVTSTLVPRLVKVETGQVIYQPTVSASRQISSCSDANYATVGDNEMLADARREVFLRIAADVAPHVVDESLPVKLSGDGLTGAPLDSFNSGLAFARGNRLNRACEIWSALAPYSATSLGLSYNLALCQEVAGDLPGALASFQAVDRRLNAPDKDVNTALERVSGRIQAQLRAGAAPRAPDRAPKPRVSGGREPSES